MRRIVSPTDFSDAAYNANVYAAQVAKYIDAQLVLVHVMHVPAIDVNSTANVLDSLMEAQRKSTQIQLDAVAEMLKEQLGVEATTRSDFGLAPDIIVDLAKDEDATMVIMGTSGSSNMIEQLLGTVSYGVVKRCPMPILVVPRNSTFEGMDHIAFANDHTEDVGEQLNFIRELIGTTERPVDIVSVEPGKDQGYYEEECVCDEDGIREICVWSDEVGHGIIAYANKHKMHWVAVKRHHRTFFENLFHHSTTKEMLHTSAIPVLVFN